MDNNIILVDDNDNEAGYGEKLEVHQKKLLHRAFSIFVFDWTNHKLLLQKRACSKYHSGGLWTNACCSHPRKNETMDACLNHRLKEELGLNTDFHIVDPNDCVFLLDGDDTIYYCGKFKYFASFGEIAEHEIDHVFLYSPVMSLLGLADFSYDPNEIEELKWVTIEELTLWMEQSPEDFTAWFKRAFELAYEVLRRQARDMDMFFTFRGQS